jgi:PAS domain S-box-containing protein
MTRQPSDAQDSTGDAGQLPGIPATTGRQQIEQLTQMLASIVESSDDAIIAKTLDGVITSWNRAAERIFGYAADEIIGWPISILKPPGHSEDVIQILEHIRRGERVNHFETKRCTKDGRIIDVSLSVSPILDAEGKIVGASKIARDITERKRAEEERERLLAAAEAANRMKDEFLATLSHELRTPLNAIVGWAQMLGSGKVDAQDLEEGLAAIERNARVQSQLVEDLLDISRINAGNLRLDVQRVKIADVIEAALRRHHAGGKRQRHPHP